MAKFIVNKTSDWDYKEIVEINSIEELLTFRDNCHHPIIISTSVTGDNKIEIYDDYRE